MEDIINSFNLSFGQGLTTPSAQMNSEHAQLYKTGGRIANQDDRRKEILETQKSNRNNKLDLYRGIMDLVNAVDETDCWGNKKRVHYRPNIYVAGFTKAANYRDVLMLSEWMMDKPKDFHENWLVVPCPKGVRMLLVANKGNTKCYTKYGQFRFSGYTALPGGNPMDGKNNKSCVLDCFYSEKINTMFVLDLLAWNNQPMTDCETEFRHFWLKSMLSEIPELNKICKKNQFRFTQLSKSSCEKESFNEFMMVYPAFQKNYPALDGLLFYHKMGHYFGGETPLVGWLYPFMVPEVLGAEVTVHPLYLASKPAGYTNHAMFVQEFEAKYAKKNRLSTRNRHMSISEQEQDEDATKADEMEAEVTAESRAESIVGETQNGDSENEIKVIQNGESNNIAPEKFKGDSDIAQNIGNGVSANIPQEM